MFVNAIIYAGAEQQIVEDFLRRHPDSTNVLVQASGKLVLIDKLLPRLKANGHKVPVTYRLVHTFLHHITDRLNSLTQRFP